MSKDISPSLHQDGPINHHQEPSLATESRMMNAYHDCVANPDKLALKTQALKAQAGNIFPMGDGELASDPKFWEELTAVQAAEIYDRIGKGIELVNPSVWTNTINQIWRVNQHLKATIESDNRLASILEKLLFNLRDPSMSEESKIIADRIQAETAGIVASPEPTHVPIIKVNINPTVLPEDIQQNNWYFTTELFWLMAYNLGAFRGIQYPPTDVPITAQSHFLGSMENNGITLQLFSTDIPGIEIGLIVTTDDAGRMSPVTQMVVFSANRF